MVLTAVVVGPEDRPDLMDEYECMADSGELVVGVNADTALGYCM